MEPKYHDGDVLIVEKSTVSLGDIGIFTLDGNGFVKVLGKNELISLNKAYDPIPMDESVICNGKVIGILEPDWIAQ
jgi:phage repressor protein C with HTH and peptisase S24 domain